MRLCRDDLRRRAVAVTPRVVMAYGRSLRRLVAGVAVGAGTAAGVAVYPLFTREPPSASSEASWWHDAFQGSRVGAAAMVAARLLRDAVTIALVSREYSTALAGGMTDLSTVHRAGAARILRLCQVCGACSRHNFCPVCLSVCLSVCQPTCLAVCLLVCLSVFVSVCA